MQDYNAALTNAGGFLREIEKAHANPLPGDPLAKSTFSESSSPTSGLTYYDLETGAKFVYPLLTPLRNEIPRVSGKGGIQANWRAVTGINTTGLRIGVSGGNRGGVQAVTTQDYSAAYKGIGIETSVDFEAQYAGMGFDDVKAIGAKIGLEACMLGEELLILGGNTSVPLGTTPTPSLAPSTSGGSLTAAASPYSVICVALSLDAVVNGSVSGGIQGAITRSNADGSSDTFGGGAAGKSANATASIASGTTGSIAATRRAGDGRHGLCLVLGRGRLGSARRHHHHQFAGHHRERGRHADRGLARRERQFDQCAGVRRLALSGLQVRLQRLCAISRDRHRRHRLDADRRRRRRHRRDRRGAEEPLGQLPAVARHHVGRLAGRQRPVEEDPRRQRQCGAALRVRKPTRARSAAASWCAPISTSSRWPGPKTIDIRVHPNMPAGTILMTSRTLPYPLSNVGNVMQIRTRQDYYQIEWPPRARRYETGVYADEVLQHYFPPSMAVIANIAAG